MASFAERAEDMASRYAAGETLDSIGKSYGVTRERVRQILREHGQVTAEHARGARHAAEQARLAAIRARAFEYLSARPGLTRQEAARRLDVEYDDLVAALGADAHRCCFVRRHRRRRTSPRSSFSAPSSGLRSSWGSGRCRRMTTRARELR